MEDELPDLSLGNWRCVRNPLMEGLPKFDEISNLHDKLAFNPLAGVDVDQMGFMDRDSLLVGEKVPLEPTSQSLRAAATWWGMLTAGLQARNPTIPEAKRKYWKLINSVARGEDIFPQTPTRGMAIHVVKGPTGTGKSVTANRFCKLVPQVMVRGRDESAGWGDGMKQLIFLEIMMSHDGTRGGFLTGILLEMDRVLGTSYAIDIPKRFRTIEKQVAATIGRLVAHFTGILFVDEGQLRNLVLSGQAELMQMFLLALMNSGIPLVLIGNEKAFDWITYSQDKSRLSINPPEIFAPVGAVRYPGVEDDWDAVANGVMGYYVLRNPITKRDECKQMLRCVSGGVARLALTLWCSAQRVKLYSGIETIGPEDIRSAYEDRGFDDLRPLADGFFYKKPELLTTYPDVDAAFYARYWGVGFQEPEEGANGVQGGASISNANQDAPKAPRRRKTEQEKFATEQVGKQKKQKRREDLSKSLSNEDIRKQGMKNIHLAGLEAAREAAGKRNK